MVQQALDPSALQALLKKDAPVERSPYVPPNKYVRWIDDKRICKPGSCGSTAYVMVDNEPMCLKHGFDRLTDIVTELLMLTNSVQ